MILAFAWTALPYDLFGRLDRNPGSRVGYSAQNHRQVVKYAQTARNASVICETGFNAGHSAAVWLASSRAEVHMFDHMKLTVSSGAADILSSEFPNRFILHVGDTRETLKDSPLRGCDVFSVNGDHSEDGALTDLRLSLALVAPCAIGFIDDVNCDATWCAGPSKALSNFLNETEGVTIVRRFRFNKHRGMSKFRYPCPKESAKFDPPI